VADGAEWTWKHVKALFPHARQVLDYYHCAHYVYNIAQAQYGTSLQGLEWAEATMTRLYVGKVSAVRGGLRRMQPPSDEAAQASAHGWAYLDEHRVRPPRAPPGDDGSQHDGQRHAASDVRC
jgi:hypothetical protein